MMLNVNEIKFRVKSSRYRTQAEFARSIDLTPSGFKKILNTGKTKNETILKMCDALSVQPHEILMDESIREIINDRENEKTGISSRIMEFMRAKNISQTDFAARVGINKSTLATVIDRDSASLVVIQKIFKAYPELSTRWLILGLGRMEYDFEHMDSFADSVASEPKSNYHTDVSFLRSELAVARDEIKHLTRLLNIKK